MTKADIDEIGLKSSLVRRHGLAEADLGAGTLVLLSETKGNYCAISGSALRIWQLLQQPMTIEEVCDRLVAEFDVEEEQCIGEVLAFARQLLEQDLVQVSNP